MNLFTPKQIYSNIKEAPAWNINRGNHTVKVVTIITERSFWKFHHFKTSQFFPLCKCPTYNGELVSNDGIKSVAVEEKAIAILWLNEYINKKDKQ